ncbi:MAG TPA: hypothetical protein VN281_20070, partial [Verrucomicrobiae bacterium]|nr:hypothetical protein [Verrucomicrobiae bacterium]
EPAWENRVLFCAATASGMHRNATWLVDVCSLHIFSMFGSFQVRSNSASVGPWLMNAASDSK